MTHYTATINGEPVTQGSLVAYRGRIINTKTKELHRWRELCATGFLGVVPIEGPVTVDLVFRLLKPKTVKRDAPHVKPDLDKLTRAVLDALTGYAYHDDGQVTRITATKVYAPKAGVTITVSDSIC